MLRVFRILERSSLDCGCRFFKIKESWLKIALVESRSAAFEPKKSVYKFRKNSGSTKRYKTAASFSYKRRNCFDVFSKKLQGKGVTKQLRDKTHMLSEMLLPFSPNSSMLTGYKDWVYMSLFRIKPLCLPDFSQLAEARCQLFKEELQNLILYSKTTNGCILGNYFLCESLFHTVKTREDALRLLNSLFEFVQRNTYLTAIPSHVLRAMSPKVVMRRWCFQFN